MAGEIQPPYFGEEIKQAIEIARGFENRGIDIIRTDRLPIDGKGYALMLPPKYPGAAYKVYYLDSDEPLTAGHHILHELGHIVRYLRVPRQERLAAAGSEQNLGQAAADLKDEINRLLIARGLSLDNFPRVLKNFYNYLFDALACHPVDIRVEQWIHDNFPSVRAAQSDFLRSEISEIEETLADDLEIDSQLPTIMTRRKAMTVARALQITGLYEDQLLLGSMVGPDIMKLGEQLVQSVLDPIDEGHRSDMRAIDDWAKKLGMVGWYQWIQHEASRY